MDLNDKIAVAACHLEEGRRIVDLLRKRIAGGERTPLQRYHWAQCSIARAVKLGWLLQDKVAILPLCSGRQGRPF